MLKLTSNSKTMMRYNSYLPNWQKIITDNINYSEGVAQWIYFAIQTKHWQVISDSRGFKLCVLVDKVSKGSHRCAIGLVSEARAAAVLLPVSGQCRV